MRSYKILMVALISVLSAHSQLDKRFFKKLQTERVASSNNVEWKQFGPGMAGYCEEFWCHPTDENVMFMSPDMYNSYGSWDNGESWQTIKDFDGTGKDMRRLKAVTFSHQDPDFGFAIDVRGQLYKTVDLGRNWLKIKSFPGKGKYSVLTVDPSNDNNWYMGAGDFWNVKANHRTKENTGGHVYKYAAYGHVFKSTDKGRSWKKVNRGLPKTLDVARIIVDPRNSNNIILASNMGVYKSINGGESWITSANGLPNNLPRDMAYFYDKASREFILYLVEQSYYVPNGKTIGVKGGIYKSIDSGNNWTNISGNIALDYTKITTYDARKRYYKVMGHWFGKTEKEIKKMYPEYPTQMYTTFNRLVVNPLNKNEVYLSHNVKHDKAFGPGDVWKTIDGGKHWIATTRSGVDWLKDKNADYWASRKNPRGINTKFAHLQNEMNNRPEVSGNRFMQINSKGELFLCVEQQILRSNNRGNTWSQIDDYETQKGSNYWVGRGGSNLPGRFMLLETGQKGRKLFCSGEHGLWQSTNLGEFQNKNAVAVKQIEGQNNHKGATSIASVAVNPKDPKMIYMIMFRQNHRGYLRRSIDGGKTWENISNPLDFGGNKSMEHIFQYSLVIDKDNPNNIYFCVIKNPVAEVSGQRLPKGFSKFGVLKSTDAGYTWKVSNSGLPNASVRRISIDPNNSNVLYAAVNEGVNKEKGGLYKSVNQGETWKKVKIPSQIKAVNNVFIDEKTKTLFISCGTEKGSLDEGGVWKSVNNGKKWMKIFEMPYIWQTEVSPVNSNIITVNVPLPNERLSPAAINPGAYLSQDGGKTWAKINKNLGQPDTIVDLKPDPEKENVLWCALKGSGWAKAIIK